MNGIRCRLRNHYPDASVASIERWNNSNTAHHMDSRVYGNYSTVIAYSNKRDTLSNTQLGVKTIILTDTVDLPVTLMARRPPDNLQLVRS